MLPFSVCKWKMQWLQFDAMNCPKQTIAIENHENDDSTLQLKWRISFDSFVLHIFVLFFVLCSIDIDKHPWPLWAFLNPFSCPSLLLILTIRLQLILIDLRFLSFCKIEINSRFLLFSYFYREKQHKFHDPKVCSRGESLWNIEKYFRRNDREKKDLPK